MGTKSETINEATGQRNEEILLCKDQTVLVADADEVRRSAVCDALFGCGISADEAGELTKAVSLAEEHSYNMFFLADSLFAEAGRERAEICGELAAGKEHALLFLMTESEEPALAETCAKDGFSACIRVPFEKDALRAFLEQWVPEECRQYLEEEPEVEVAYTDMVRIFMAGVDVVSAVKKNGGMDDYKDLLDIFYTDGQKRMGSLKDKIEKEDIENYTIEVHGLKSAAANIGADTLSALAKQQEEYGNASDLESIRANMDEMFDCYEKVLGELRRVLMDLEYGQFARLDESLPEIGKEELLARLHEILGSLEDFQSKEATGGMEALLGCGMPQEIRSRLEPIHVMLKMYEDDDAEDALRELLEELE